MFDDLGIVGVSWRQADSAAVSRFSLPAEEAAERLRAFAAGAGVEELAYLSTCNRVELIFAGGDSEDGVDLRASAFESLTGTAPAPGEAQRSLKAWAGEGAAEHLFLVAAGLDSACVGESEIVGQVRECRRMASDLGLAGPRLDLLFEEAHKVAAEVRGDTGLSAGRLSLAEIAVERVMDRLERTPGAVALVGVSTMTERAATSLSQAGVELIVANRSAGKAAELARSCGGASMSLDDLRRRPPRLEAVLTATGASQPVLSKADLERLAARSVSGQGPLIVDMAVPPDADPAACEALGLERIGMDEIVAAAQRNRQARVLEMAEARERIDAALLRLRERFTDRMQGPLFGALQDRYRRTAREGVDRLLAKELRGLGSEERQAIETWCEVLARRFAHIPCLGLRGLLQSGPEGSVQAFLAGLEPELAAELEAALDTGLLPSRSRQE